MSTQVEATTTEPAEGTQPVEPTKKPKPKNMPHNSAFKQQRLRAWQPILTTRVVVGTFSIIGPLFLLIGILAIVASEGVQEYSVRYDQDCFSSLIKSTASTTSGSACTAATITVTKAMSKPVYMYYELDNYYQNHRRYVKSRNDDQLRGDSVSSSTADDCSPLVDADDLGSTNYYYQYMTAGETMFPCGLVAVSVFNDTITLCEQSNACTSTFSQTRTGTAWSSDKDWKFSKNDNHWVGKVTDESNALLWPDGVEDENFITWMRVAALPKFRKLYRIIDQDIPAGTYQLQIYNRYDVSGFSGKKSVVLSTTSWLGGKNLFLGVAYCVVGGIIIMLAILFAVKSCVQPRKLGQVPGGDKMREAH